jgi:hypothetical protein
MLTAIVTLAILTGQQPATAERPPWLEIRYEPDRVVRIHA